MAITGDPVLVIDALDIEGWDHSAFELTDDLTGQFTDVLRQQSGGGQRFVFRMIVDGDSYWGPFVEGPTLYPAGPFGPAIYFSLEAGEYSFEGWYAHEGAYSLAEVRAAWAAGR